MPMLDVDGSSLYYVVKGKGTPILFYSSADIDAFKF